MRHLPIFLFVLLCYPFTLLLAQGAPLKLEPDSVKIMNAELVLRNQSKNVNGYLYNTGNGTTAFRQLGKSIEFHTGTPGYPAAGDSVFQDASLANLSIKVMRNGLLQYRGGSNGVVVDAPTGSIVFRPALQANEHIFIEAIFGLELSVNGGNDNGGGPSTASPLRMQTGASDNGNNTFTLRWATNAKTLFLGPKVVGLGSSTLAGAGLSAPNRLGDKISAWLTNNTAGHTWTNLAVSGYSTKDILPLEDGGVGGQNIETAVQLKPDFLFVSLPSNDPSSGIPVVQSMINLRKVDSIAQRNGITVFFETTQPRTNYNTLQQQMLKLLADSIRNAWPDRFVEGFTDVADPSSIAAILPAYDNGDGIHLNSAGNQFIADRLFDRWLGYFQSITGVKKYYIDSSLNQTTWAPFAQQADANVVKATYNRYTNAKVFFRVRAEMKNGTFTPWSPIATLNEPDLLPGVNDYTYRLLTDLGGDGVSTLNGSNQIDGRPTPSPDGWGKYWNNWFGKGGVEGFGTNASFSEMRTTTNEITDMSVQFIGSPTGSFGTSPTKAINYNGFTVPVGDYPQQALYDNMFIHNSLNPNGIVLRIKGLVPTNKYYIKIWGARLDDGAAQRTLQARIGTAGWETAQSVETKYATSASPNYQQAVKFNGVTGLDSVDITLRVGGTGTFAHVSLIDIGVVGPLPAIPQIRLRDTTTTLTTMQLTATPINGATISAYSWEQVSGPGTATIGNATSATANISGLTNGTYVFRVSGTASGGKVYNGVSTVSVFPDNGGLKTLRVHFSKTAVQPIPGWVNVYGSPHAARIMVTDPATTWTIDNLSPTPDFWAPFANNSASDIDGTTTGNNTGVIPDIALKGYWFNYSLKYATGMDNLAITGLNPAKTYKLKFYASRNNTATAPRYGAWRINGGAEILMNALNNTSLEEVRTGISPDANGKINLSVHAPSLTTNGAYGYLNALVIQEE
ncbi:SGNH/GDSL hydrolase family protein [Chitinophaga rhizosphaerae]|uniref:SGNH/GDSL hydrolase family protein n=1 Tax=Chitinophaga rhizosphaerae TaxID=1864947 RepID=UPI000F80C41A|nr:SGNH/GDSL hydrolase family protein [Chitinophaga rhizosphaerae]